MPGEEAPDPAELAEAFAAEHERRYGFRDHDAPVELIAIATGLSEAAAEPRPQAATAPMPEPGTRRVRFAGEWHDASVLRGDLPAGTGIAGPAVLELPETTLVLPPEWSAEVDDHGTVVAER